MSTQLPQDDIHSFIEFLTRRANNGGRDLSPEQSVQEYRAYQEELERFLSDSQKSFDQAAQGDHGPIDIDAIMDRVVMRISQEESDR